MKNSENSVLGEMLAALGCAEHRGQRRVSAGGSFPWRPSSRRTRKDLYRDAGQRPGEDAAGAGERHANPAWQQLGAVKNGGVYYMDQQLLQRSRDARWGEAYENWREILYVEKRSFRAYLRALRCWR